MLFSTYEDALGQMIEDIEAGANSNDYDIGAIADEFIESVWDGCQERWRLSGDDPYEFWDFVDAHHL